jgi:cytochrome c oxidase subunit 2
MFFWGANVYFDQMHAPANSMEIFVTGKQWMWKFQHPTGKKEINDLHVPAGRPIKLIMATEDVIHDFYVPAFRVKMDVMPGKYNTSWFHATKTGEYHLFCNQYCGKDHAKMVGRIIVQTPEDYELWLSGGNRNESPLQSGERLFSQWACNTCHLGGAQARGPALAGVFGRNVILQGGRVVTADETYLRESILIPTAKIVDGYQPIMPTFKGLLSEEQVMNLVSYIKTMQPEGATGAAAPAKADTATTAGARKE